jgi:polar amino acid transport system substrate-binding protein
MSAAAFVANDNYENEGVHMFARKVRFAAVFVAAVALLVGCSSGSGAKSDASVRGAPDYAYLENLGWRPADNHLTYFACQDSAYADALKNGLKLGVYTAAPYEMIDTSTNTVSGLDWDINMAVLKYLGIDKYTTVTLQWDEMIPALNSKRIDVITGNIHQTTDRLKNMGFTSPAWWYGSSLIVPKGNPGNIQAWADLTRSGVKVGVINGSQSQTYLEGIGADIVTYQDANSEFASLAGNREDVVVDDGPKAAAYIQANPDAGLTIQQTSDIPPADLLANYARYGVRQGDCSLNAAYSRALSELRDHGVVGKILANYGLTDNLFEPQYKP